MARKSYSFYKISDLVLLLTDPGSDSVQRILAVQFLTHFQEDDGFYFTDDQYARLGEFGIGNKVPGAAGFIQPFVVFLLGRAIVAQRVGPEFWAVKFLTKAVELYAPWHPVHQAAKHWLNILNVGGV